MAAAALWALGNIGNEQAATFLVDRAKETGFPTPRNVAVPLLRCAYASVSAGENDKARVILDNLAARGMPSVSAARL